MRNQSFYILIASLLLSLLYCPPVNEIYDDQGVFQYAGILIAKGHVPYLDLFDHKPPLIYFVNYFASWLGSWGLWIVDAALVAGATLFFYRRCREKQLPYPWILPLFFNLLIRNYLVCQGYGMTRTYTAIFLLLAFCILLGRSRYLFFWLGLLTAATLLMQQDQLLPLLPLLAYAFITHWTSARVFLKRVVQAGAGFLVIAVPILLYFGLHHALAALWRDAFLFNFAWYSDRTSFPQEFRAVHAALKNTDNELPLLICATLAITALLLHAKEKRLLIAALLATAFAFAPQLFSARLTSMGPGFYYYFTPLAGVLPILAFAAWTSTDHFFLRSKLSQAVFGFLFCAPLVYDAAQHATHLNLHNKSVVTSTPEYQYLQRQSLSDYQLYIVGSNHWVHVYDEHQILAPSPWIYQHFWTWYPRWDTDHRILSSIGRDLLAHHTRFIIDFTGPSFYIDPTAYAWWRTFLQQHYQPVQLPDARRQVLWKLKPEAIKTPLPADPPAS